MNIFLCLLLCFSLNAFALGDSGRINSETSYTKIAPDTYVVTDEAYHESNVLVARMPDNTVIIASSPFETKSAEAMMTWIQKEFKPKKIIAINTHYHADGTGGNEAYQNHNVEIWASEMTQGLHIKNGESGKIVEARGMGEKPELQQRIKQRVTVPAPHTFKESEGKEFIFEKEQVKVIYPGPAHTKDNVVVYLPQKKVLFGGCMIKAGSNIGYLGDAVVESWEASATKLLSLDVQVVIPGHGKKFGGKELIENSISLAAAAKKAKK